MRQELSGSQQSSAGATTTAGPRPRHTTTPPSDTQTAAPTWLAARCRMACAVYTMWPTACASSALFILVFRRLPYTSDGDSVQFCRRGRAGGEDWHDAPLKSRQPHRVSLPCRQGTAPACMAWRPAPRQLTHLPGQPRHDADDLGEDDVGGEPGDEQVGGEGLQQRGVQVRGRGEA